VHCGAGLCPARAAQVRLRWSRLVTVRGAAVSLTPDGASLALMEASAAASAFPPGNNRAVAAVLTTRRELVRQPVPEPRTQAGNVEWRRNQLCWLCEERRTCRPGS